MTEIVIFAVDNGVYSFKGFGRRVTVNKAVVSVWHMHRQLVATSTESFGVLMGTTSIDRSKIWIEAVTTPMLKDKSSKFSFALRDPSHQQVVNRRFASSNCSSIYLGTWHTHPEPTPTPSSIDLKDWSACLRANHKRPLTFVIVGTEEICMFVRSRGRFKPLCPDC